MCGTQDRLQPEAERDVCEDGGEKGCKGWQVDDLYAREVKDGKCGVWKFFSNVGVVTAFKTLNVD